MSNSEKDRGGNDLFLIKKGKRLVFLMCMCYNVRAKQIE